MSGVFTQSVARKCFSDEGWLDRLSVIGMFFGES